MEVVSVSRRSVRNAHRVHIKKRLRRYPKPNKRLAAAFRVAVDPHSGIQYDCDGHKVTIDVRFTPHRKDGLKRPWPVFGFMCPECGWARSNAWHFWVNKDLAVCEECAMKRLEVSDE